MHDFTDSDLLAIEKTTQQVGAQIFERLRKHQPSVFQRQWWDDRVMDWAMREESVKVQAFRFVDVLPMLTSSRAIIGHLQEYFADIRHHLPAPVRMGLAVAKPGSIAGRVMAIAARRNAAGQAKRFIAGTDAAEVLAAVKRQRRLGRTFTLDVLGEAVISEAEADVYLDAYIRLIEDVAPRANAWPEIPQVDQGVSGPLPRMNVSVKLSALDSRFDPMDPVGTTRRVAGRLRTLLRTARQHQAFVNVDMESYKCKDLTIHIFKQIMSEDEFRDTGDVGIVIQCYLKDALRDLAGLRDWAIERGKPVWVRLVKGAYWDYETTHAIATGWPVPVFQQKWQSDAQFERATRFVMRNFEHLRPALGSHNMRSIACAIATAKHLGLSDHAFEIQMLYGMGDPEKQVLTDMGHRLRVYMPYGQLIPGMAYLVRRLLENTSNDSFLRASFSENLSSETLLADPFKQSPLFGTIDSRIAMQEAAMQETTMENRTMQAAAPRTRSSDADPFAPVYQCEPPTDFAIEANRQAMQTALEQVAAQLGQSYPLRIGGKSIETEGKVESTNPSKTCQVVGIAASATAEHANQAIAAASAALRGWAAIDVKERADLLRRAADEMRRRRFELSAWMTYECGKPWRESDGDVAEAIDFCEYYAAGAETMYSVQGVDVPGENNRFEYLPRGVVGVISPWNFPLAILTGMVTAALATGNTVVMKPAGQSPVIAAKLMEIFDAVGFPPGVINYLPGPGSVAGAAMVDHPDVALIAFTGSREVGLAINARAAEVSTSGTTMVKRVIAEMGGKNAIIVDDDADLDEAVLGVAQSAFGFQGQKCSACSRCIVLDSAYDAFLPRLVEATRSLHVGPADDPASQMGPVIDALSLAKIHEAIETGRSEGRLAIGVDVGELAEQGHFVGPHIFADVKPDAKIAQQEIFGPVLAVIRVADLDEALRVANDTDYALTGGIFSRSPVNLDRVRRELMVGNIYINRPITGALVSRQPFGGFKMSGIGSKAGGPDYLYQFVVPRTITENTMRRGFAPPSSGEAS